jgi:hypothetical protein
MGDREEKPNWIAEYGEEGEQFYPEMFHHSTWMSLVAGATMAPVESIAPPTCPPRVARRR